MPGKWMISLGIMIIFVLLFSGCTIEEADFELHEWGVFVKGYECDDTMVRTISPHSIFVEKPLLYFHGITDPLWVEIRIDSIRNATTVPSTVIKDGQILWDVMVEDDKIVSLNGTKYDRLFYEGEITTQVNVSAWIMVSAGNATFHVENLEDYSLSNIIFIYGYPTGEPGYVYRGITYAYADSLEGGRDLYLVVPLRNTSTWSLEDFRAGLADRGLYSEEIDELLHLWERWWFYPTNLGNYSRLVFIIPQSVYDKLLPIHIKPEPKEMRRVGIFTITDIPILSLELSTDKATYEPGENVTISLRISNHGNQDASLTFRSAKLADLEILDEKGERVYLWSHGKYFAQVITHRTIEAGKRVEILNITWNQIDNRGLPIKPGVYRVRGWLALPKRVYSNEVIISISG